MPRWPLRGLLGAVRATADVALGELGVAAQLGQLRRIVRLRSRLSGLILLDRTLVVVHRALLT